MIPEEIAFQFDKQKIRTKMSSLQENSTVPLDVVNKRKTPFSRSDSFDKFQYTAFYTLQLAGKFTTVTRHKQQQYLSGKGRRKIKQHKPQFVIIVFIFFSQILFQVQMHFVSRHI